MQTHKWHQSKSNHIFDKAFYRLTSIRCLLISRLPTVESELIIRGCTLWENNPLDCDQTI